MKFQAYDVTCTHAFFKYSCNMIYMLTILGKILCVLTLKKTRMKQDRRKKGKGK